MKEYRCHKREFLLKFSKDRDRWMELWRCLVYVDLSMVRAGVVDHPSEWKWSGYNEIQKPKIRYRLNETIVKYGSTAANPAESDYPKLPDTNTVPWKWEDSLKACF